MTAHRVRQILFSLFALLELCGAIPWVSGTQIDPMLWEEFARDADLIGIVECRTAGGIVADFVVVDSWKGPPAGTRVILRTAVNYWEPQFPISLVGERYLVGGFKSCTPTRSGSISGTSFPVPLWWRSLPADYDLPLFQGRLALAAPVASGLLSRFGSGHGTIESFREAVQSFLALPPDAAELLLLQRQAEKYLFGTHARQAARSARQSPAVGSESDGDASTPELDILEAGILRATSVEEAVRCLLAYPGRNFEGQRGGIARVLQRGGGTRTLAILEDMQLTADTIDGEVFRRTLQAIHDRLDDWAGGDADLSSAQPEEVPSAAELQSLRTRWNRASIAEKIDVLWGPLSRWDPVTVVDYLLLWMESDADRRFDITGYRLGSCFAWQCGRDRAENLGRLASARDPFIRVAGAVYLCFEDRTEGMSRLRKLADLPGDAGVWAALNLARRGDPSAVERALAVLAEPGAPSRDGAAHHNFQKRLMVLLSNSAARSGIDQPPPLPRDGDPYISAAERELQYRLLHDSVRNWWAEHRDRITLTDPWMKPLERQKVD